MYLTSAQHKKMYSGGGNYNFYQQPQQQQQQNNNSQTPLVGSDYGYGGNSNFNFTSSSLDLGSFLSRSLSSGNSSNAPYYALPNSNSNSNYNSVGASGGSDQTNYNNYNLNSNSNNTSRQSEYTAAYQTQGYQNSSENNNSNRRKEGGWVKRDSLKRTTPYSSAKGSNMLQKMGWNPGQSLGKRQNGLLEPPMPEIKTNRRGFDVSTPTVAVPMHNRNKPKQIGPQRKTISLVTDGKNPISILEEYSSKRKLTPPRYEAIVDEGPVHAKTFVFKVVVDGVDYPSEKGSNVKKQAKAEAARNCLVKLGVLKKPTAV